jgi:hypothetical protein
MVVVHFASFYGHVIWPAILMQAGPPPGGTYMFPPALL